MLTKPQDSHDLAKVGIKSDDIAITTFDFQDKEATTFLIGTEEGVAYQANRFERAGSKSGVNKNEAYKAHTGPITGLQFHPSSGQFDFSDLFLTSSVDWSVKLWRYRDQQRTTGSAVQPLRSFDDFGDYVLDVAWSPSHPAVFSAVDAEGRYTLWNLNAETEVPVKVTNVGNKGLNKIRWSKDGTKNAIASSDGNVYVYDTGDLATAKPHDWEKFHQTISEFGSSSL